MDIIIGKNNLSKTIRDLRNYVNGKSYQELLENKDYFFTNIANEDGTLFDFDYGCLSGTINNDNGMAKLSDNFDVWNDHDCTILFTFEVRE